MKALLDTNVIIHRESPTVASQGINILLRWLERGRYTKYIHSIAVDGIKKSLDQKTANTLLTKLRTTEKIEILPPPQKDVSTISEQMGMPVDDENATILLYEVFTNHVDILVTENEATLLKAEKLNIQDKVFTIDSFLERVLAENPELVNYKVLNVKKIRFCKINLNDSFFDSLRKDYPGFEKWFEKKRDDEAYITINSNNGRLLSFLYLKIEDVGEDYSDIVPCFPPKKRLKIGTFKVINNGFRLGERFLKIVFDNALKNNVKEIYVTVFNKSDEQKRLVSLLQQWGFVLWGKKGEEDVYVRNFEPAVNMSQLKLTYPYISGGQHVFIVPIHPEYHTELLPDSILDTERPEEFVEDSPHRNCICKVYVSHAIPPHPKAGDILIFYRTGGLYKSVITTIGVVQELRYDFKDENSFISYCRKNSVFPEEELRKMWKTGKKLFAVRFLYVYSFPHRITMKELIDMKVLSGPDDAPRGFKPITKENLCNIIKATRSDDSFIIN